MARIEESTTISGVYLVRLRPFADERGQFIETFRTEWFPQRQWRAIQTNRSDSHRGVLRGLHFHRQQVDYWYVTRGRLRVALADLRQSSGSYLTTQTIDLSAENSLGLFIPVGVAHGYVALSGATLIYVVDQYYNGQDEFGVAWDDPDLDIDWGVASPLVSDRDRQNPPLGNILPADLPG